MIGKPNVGKSSLINKLLGENRVIVSPIAGTTRDSIDTPFEKDGEKYLLIDTAGIRRKSKVNENIEKFSVIRAVAAIERCDVCLLMIDAQEGITEQDKKIAGIAHEAGKGIVVVVNKWDLIEKETNTMNDFKKNRKGAYVHVICAVSVHIGSYGTASGQRHKYGEVRCGEQSHESTYRTAEQPDVGCYDDETAAVGQGQETEDILCDTGGRQTAAVLLQGEFKTSDAFLLCQISGEQDQRGVRIRRYFDEIRIQGKGRKGRCMNLQQL